MGRGMCGGPPRVEAECDEVDAEIWRARIASSLEHGGVGFLL